MTDQEPKPATDEEIAEFLALHRKEGGGYWNCDLDANVTVRQLIARIEADAATIREREQQIKRCHGIIETMISNCEVDQSHDAERELSGEFCPGECTSECDRRSREQAEEIAELRARVQTLEAILARRKAEARMQ